MTATVPGPRMGRLHLNRRAYLGAGLGAAAALTVRSTAARPTTAGGRAWPVAPGDRRDLAAWRTWLLASADEVRPGAPAAPTDVELAELIELQRSRTEATAAGVARWGNGPAVMPWTEVALDLIKTHKPNPPPAGPGVWEPTPPGFVDPPLEPLAGTWAPWVIPSVVGARPGPPPAYGSPAWQAEVAAVQEAVARRTPAQEVAAHFWAGGPGTVTPAGLWIEIARDLIRRDGLGSAPAARMLALTSAALHDAFVCCWDAKFAYWVARPITADPHLAVLFPTPPFPSYTSGHSTISSAAATALGHLFPADEYDLRRRADEARDSRLWAGIHFPIDNEVGASKGAAVGRLVADYARHDGAE